MMKCCHGTRNCYKIVVFDSLNGIFVGVSCKITFYVTLCDFLPIEKRPAQPLGLGVMLLVVAVWDSHLLQGWPGGCPLAWEHGGNTPIVGGMKRLIEGVD